MTKLIVSLFFLLVCLNNPLAQVDNVTGQFVDKGNLLQSPGAESGKKGWTNVAGTFTVESTGAIKGSRVFKVALSSQTLNLYQDSISYASEFNGSVQGISYAYVKTSLSGIKLCARKAGVTQTSLCVSHTGSGKWELLKVPFILGATSNGLAIISSGNVSGNVYIDDSFLGAVDLSATQSFDTTCDTAACETIFTAYIATNGTVSQENQDFISGNCSFGTTVSCNFVSSLFSIAPNVNYTIVKTLANSGLCGSVGNLESTTTSVSTSSFSASFVCTGQTGNASYAPEGGIWITVLRQGTDYKAALTAQKNFQKSKVSSYSSTNADTDWQACSFSTLAWQGLGTVSSVDIVCKRQGSDLLMKGRFTTGTTSASIAQIPLPVWNGPQLVSANSSKISLGIAGSLIRNTTSANATKDLVLLLRPSVSYFAVGYREYAITTSPFSEINGSSAFANSEVQNFDIRIPIEGWENSNVIVAQLSGLESCKDSYECEDSFEWYTSSTGVVSNEKLDIVNGNCTVATSTVTCNFRSGVFVNSSPNCNVTVFSTGTAIETRIKSATTSQIIFDSYSSTGSPSIEGFTVRCSKGPNDYTNSTAKAVASDQNVRSIGSTGMDMQSVYFGSGATCSSACTSGTCTICGQVGTKITSVTWASLGNYNVNGIDGTKYICTANGTTASTFAAGNHSIPGSSSTFARINYGSGASFLDVYRASVTCIGIP